MKKPLRDDMSIYTPKLINIVLPKLSHDTILAELKSREPALFKFVGKLAEKIVSETFNEGDSAIEIASKMMISFQSAILTGVVLSEAVKKEQDIEDLRKSYGEETPPCGEKEPTQ